MTIRSLALQLASVLLATTTMGCTLFPLTAKNETPAPVRNNGTTEHFVKYWNANSDRIESLRCDKLEIDVDSQGQSYGLSAQLGYHREHDFRLLGKFMGKSEVDLGSNNDEIWFWIARANPPSVYFCKREELSHVKLATPFQPDWLVEVLGVGRIDVEKYREGHSNDTYFTLVTEERTPAGLPVTKRLVVDRQTNRIRAFEIFDGKKRLMEAVVEEYHDDPAIGYFVPSRLRIEWPDADTRLKIAMNPRKIEVNTITPELAASMFARGNYTNTEVVDLAQMAREQGQRQVANRAGNVRADAQMREAVGGYDRGVRPAAQLTGQIERNTVTPAPSFQ